MDIITDPVKFTNILLVQNDYITVIESFKTIITLANEIERMDKTLLIFLYTVKAGEFKDGLEYAKFCRDKFNTFKNDLSVGKLKELYNRYTEIIDEIKKKIVQRFSITDSNGNIENISKLVELLDEKTRSDFFKSLSVRMMENFPEGKFIEKYKEQLTWIFTIIEQVKPLFPAEWNVLHYIIDVWADKIRDLILDEDVKSLNNKMMKFTFMIEDKLRQIYPNVSDMIGIAFDTFCKHNMNLLFSSIAPINISNEFEGDVYKSSVDLIFTLNQCNEHCNKKLYINPRTKQIIVDFYIKYINDYFLAFSRYIMNNLNEDDLITLYIKSIKYIKSNFPAIQKKYPTFNEEKINDHSTTVTKKYYDIKKEQCIDLINKSVNKYKSISNYFKQNNTNIEIKESNEMIDIVNTVNQLDLIEESYKMTLLSEINQTYKKQIENNLTNAEILQQIMMDIAFLKEKLHVNVFDMLERQLKFIIFGNIKTPPLFVEDFKTFFGKNEAKLLETVLKMRNVDDNVFNQIMIKYNPNYAKGKNLLGMLGIN